MIAKTIMTSTLAGLAVLLGALMLPIAGCGSGTQQSAPKAEHDPKDRHDNDASNVSASTAANDDADLRAERAKLTAEDQRLVAAQEFCAISSDERLGSMGPPVKVMVKGQPVFLCCKGCQKKALANPDQTLATVAKLKAKVKAGAGKLDAEG